MTKTSISMAATIRELEGLSVRVDDVIYMPSLDAPEDKPHPFVYFITIKNGSDESVTIRGRKWVVRENDGEVTVVALHRQRFGLFRQRHREFQWQILLQMP